MSKEQWGCVVFVFIAGLFVFSPVVMRSSKKAPMTEATSNAKQVFYLLVEFDQDFGEFPGDTSATDPELSLYHGNYSNDYLGQLIAGGYTQSEEIFYAPHGLPNIRKPDNDTSTRAKTLEEGECGFAYVKNLNSKAPSETPILLAPMYGDGFKLNTDIYKGKAVVLRIDGSVKQFRLDKNRHATSRKGENTSLLQLMSSQWAGEL